MDSPKMTATAQEMRIELAQLEVNLQKSRNDSADDQIKLFLLDLAKNGVAGISGPPEPILADHQPHLAVHGRSPACLDGHNFDAEEIERIEAFRSTQFKTTTDALTFWETMDSLSEPTLKKINGMVSTGEYNGERISERICIVRTEDIVRAVLAKIKNARGRDPF